MTHRPRLTVAVLALLAVGALSACEPERAGAAATVGDDRLTVAQVQQQVKDYADSLPAPVELARLDLSGFQRKIVQDFVTHRLSVDLAEQKGIDVTEAEIDRQLDAIRGQGEEQFLQALAQQGYTVDTVRDYVFDQLVAQRLGGAQAATSALTTAAKQLQPWVSPRYGTLVGAQLDGTSGSLSVPATPTPTTAATGQ